MPTARDGTQRGRRVKRWSVAGVLVAGVFAFTSLGLAAASFSDPSGDNNEAPDITSVAVSETPDGVLTISVTVGNYQTLPPSSWLNLWFDLDSNATTGDAGDEGLITFAAEGTLEFYRWNGTQLVSRATDGMTAAYAAGVLTFKGPKSAFDNTATFGVLAVASREQVVEQIEYTSADFAPDNGRSTYVGPGPHSFPDPVGDRPAAPDVTSVRVSDSKAGLISFAITTGDLPTLPARSLVLLLIDRDRKRSTGTSGADVMIIYQDGLVALARWDVKRRDFVGEAPPTRVQVRNAGGVLTLLVHRSELEDVPRFDFAVAAAHVGDDDILDAFDIAPEDLYWQYTLVNKPAVRLIVGKTGGAPVQPVAGKRFAVTLPVTRSDSGRPISSGSVTCNVRVAGKKIPAKGSVGSGKARCALIVPATASGASVRGSMAVRSAGKTVTARFAFTVR